MPDTARHPTAETTIRVDSGITTLVNLFTVEPGNRPEVLDMLKQGIETMFRGRPGWISSNLLTSRDGKQIISYSQWRDADAIAAFRQDPELQGYFKRFAGLAQLAAFTCDVSYCCHA
jgi:quinol monooxygenase YgiN